MSMFHEATPHRQPTAQPVIAIIEDDPAMQDLLGEVLPAEGYKTIRWERGDGAYEVIRAAQPDLVILDLWLEHPSAGSMVLGLLIVDPVTRHIPVIVCSAHQQLLRAQETQLRAQGYVILEKPFPMVDLLAHIRALLDGLQARQVGAA
jgi:DNA-binding response OmpR family regulator